MRTQALKFTVAGATLGLASLGLVAFAQTADQSATAAPAPSTPPQTEISMPPPSMPQPMETSMPVTMPPSGSSEPRMMPPPPMGEAGSNIPSTSSMPPEQRQFSEHTPPPPMEQSFQNGSQVQMREPMMKDDMRKEIKGHETFQNQYQGGSDMRGFEYQKPPLPPMMNGSERGRMPPEQMPARFEMGREQFDSRGTEGGFSERFSDHRGDDSMMQRQGGEDTQKRMAEEQQSREAREQKMEEERQKRETAMLKRQATQMAKNLERGLVSVNKRITTLKKQGLGLTVECTEVMATLSGTVSKIKNATTREDLEDARDAMEYMEDLGQCRQMVERLISSPKMLKNAATALKNLKRRKVDVSQLEPMLVALQSQFNALKTGTPTNEAVEAFFDAADNLGDIAAPLMNKRTSTQGAAVFNSGIVDAVLGWLGF